LKKTSTHFSPSRLTRILIDNLGIQQGAHLKLGFSGGLDSHVLLHALAGQSQRYGWSIQAIHINHGLSDQAEFWEQHCQSVCQLLEVPLTIRRIQVDKNSPDGIEAEARKKRYACFEELLEPGEVLLTAHHQNDQAETLLLQMLRGAGIKGMASMSAMKPCARGHHARPLLPFSRAELQCYAEHHQLTWVEDDSNTDSRYRRNFLRKRLMPVLEQCWPETAKVLARTAAHMADASELLEQLGRQDLLIYQIQPRQLVVSAISGLPDSRLRNLIRVWITVWGYRPPASHHINEIVACIRAPDCRHREIRWSEAEVHRYRDRLYLTPVLKRISPETCLSWDLESPLSIADTGYQLMTQITVGGGLSRKGLNKGPAQVRLRRGGESCRLPGRTFHHKLKNLLQEQGIPPWQRSRLPLLYIDGELAAIADLWVCEPFAAKPDEPGIRLIWQQR